MAYRKKEDTIRIADELGIDISGMSWPEMQKAVAQALKENDNIKKNVNTNKNFRKVQKLLANSDRTGSYSGMNVLIRPELKADAQRYLHYREQLGDEVEVDEVSYLGLEGGHINWNSGAGDMRTGTYRIKGKTGRKVEAKSSIPRQNAGLAESIGRDWLVTATFQGKSGYLYKHHYYQSLKAILNMFGVYHDYIDTLRRPGVLFYLTGLLCVRKDVADGILKDIERRVQAGEVKVPWELTQHLDYRRI